MGSAASSLPSAGDWTCHRRERSDSSHGCQGQSRAHLSADLSHASTCVWVYVQSLSLDPVDSSPPGSSVHGILQARTLEWVAMPSSRGSSRPRDQTHIFRMSRIGRQILYHCATCQYLIPEHFHQSQTKLQTSQQTPPNFSLSGKHIHFLSLAFFCPFL